RGRFGTQAGGAAALLLMPRHERGEPEALRGLGGAGAGVAEPVVVLAAGGDLGGPLTAHHSGSPPGPVRTPRPGPGSGRVEAAMASAAMAARMEMEAAKAARPMRA